MPQDRPYIIEVPGYGEIEFPAGTSPDVMRQQAMRLSGQQSADDKPLHMRGGGRGTMARNLATPEQNEFAKDYLLPAALMAAPAGRAVQAGKVALERIAAPRALGVVKEATGLLDEFGAPILKDVAKYGPSTLSMLKRKAVDATPALVKEAAKLGGASAIAAQLVRMFGVGK